MSIEGTFDTFSEDETAALAASFSSKLPPCSVVLLLGDLGAGKTSFVRGMASGLGIAPEEVSSPTFTLVQEYRRSTGSPRPERSPGEQVEFRGPSTLYHVDLYRLEGSEIDDLGLEELASGGGMTAIEWAEKLPRRPPGAITVTITDLGDDHREIRITPDPCYSDR